MYHDNYFPMNIGDTWNYRHRTDEVKGVKTFNNRTYYEVQSDSYDNTGQYYNSYKSYYRVEPGEKVYQLNSDSSTEFLIYDFTVPVNHSWTSQDWNITNSTDSKVITIKNNHIGNCIEFDYDIPQAADDEHAIILAPGIGRIITASFAWGLGDTLQSAHVNGVYYDFE